MAEWAILPASLDIMTGYTEKKSFAELWRENGGKVIASDAVPEDELWLEDEKGKTLATIINIGQS